MDLSDLQLDSAQWRDRNFPGTDSEQQLMGMVEEIGEITHHVLKRKQGIRGDEAKHNEEIIDGVCDLIIFAMGFATCEGFDIGAELDKTWEKVSKRDWIADPHQGGKDSEH